MYPWLQNTYQGLAQRAIAGRLHHGILLHGTQGLGKTELAEKLAALLLCQRPAATEPCGACQACLLRVAGNHPDWHQIRREKTQISVDQIRDGIQKLSKTAQLSGNKVLIIHEAECFNQASANALLKTLEEPTRGTYILLITHAANRLLPTILSRCEKQPVTPPPQAEGLAWLASQQVNCDEQTLALCANAPLRAKAWCEDEKRLRYDDFAGALTQLQRFEQSPLALASQWQDQAELVCGFSQYWLNHAMHSGQTDSLWSAYQLCLHTQKQLQQAGVNKTLLLTRLLSEPAFSQ